ncbi:MAG: chemotaxis protein CheX [Actinomycetota bacterium]
MTIVDSTDPELRAELIEIVAETLDGLDETMIELAPVPVVTAHPDVVVESTLRISGDDAAAGLVLRLSGDDAVALTAAMVGESADSVTLDEAVGTVGELSNVLAGAAKILLDEETELRVPEARPVDRADLDDLETVVVAHRLGRFEVHLGA